MKVKNVKQCTTLGPLDSLQFVAARPQCNFEPLTHHSRRNMQGGEVFNVF